MQTNSTGGYRANAAVAKFAKTVAADYYEDPDRRIYGYVYGGSGGSYQTVGSTENTTGVWDGAVPFIIGAPTSIPHNFFIRGFARLVLEGKAQRIGDAVAPGGGDPRGALTEMERAVFDEVTSMGLPVRCWMDASYALGLETDLLGFGGVVRDMDPTYVEDFWNEPGYLGTEQSELGDYVRSALTDHVAAITRIERNGEGTPTALVLDSAPDARAGFGLDFTVLDGEDRIGSLTGTLNASDRTFSIGEGNSQDVLDGLEEGQQLRIDNRWSIALTSYHRHQVPSRPGFYAWDQFRAEDGTPVPPQRAVEIGPLVTQNVAGGGTHNGAVNGKVIVVANLLDVDAYPWHGDWYAEQMRQSLGGPAEEHFRLWFNDHADHTEGSPEDGSNHLVDFNGVLQQALCDLAAWVEQDEPAPRSTEYGVTDSQIEVPPSAADRGGVQPVVDLTADGSDHVEVEAGQTVGFKARIEVPEDAGKLVAAEWDFEGDGTFEPSSALASSRSTTVQGSLVYDTPGVYFPALRATAQREGDTESPFGRVKNLGRMRVTVH